jgi:ABC-type glycerol-3-phosphate transport system substrate-binding protein
MKRLMIVFAVLALAAAANATTIRPMTIEEMTASASSVIEGTAVDKWSAWDSQHREIMTFTRFNVLKTLKGSAPNQVVVAQLGGTVGNIKLLVSGIRHFQIGETTLLFLRLGDTPDVMSLDTMQGNFRVVKDQIGEMVASNGMPDVSVLRGSQVVPYQGHTVALSTLESRIQKAVGR